MAVTVTDTRSIFDQLDATGSWTGSPSLFTSSPSPMEASGCLGWIVSTAAVPVTLTSGTRNLTNSLIYAWVRAFGYMAGYTAGGVGIVIGDGTNTMAYYVGGSDLGGFRHTQGGAEWVCYMLDTTSLPTNKTTIAGSEGSMSWSNITTLGVYFTTTYKAVGGVANCFADIIRYGAGGLIITGGGVGTEGNFGEIALQDYLQTDQKAYGICRELATGAYGLQGPIILGDTGTGAVNFISTGETVIFEAPIAGVARDRYFINVVGNSTGSTQVGFSGSSFICAAGVGAAFDATDSDINTLTISGCLFKGFETGVSFLSATTSGNVSVTNTTFDGCGQLDLGFLLQDGVFTGNTISNSVDYATGALLLGATGYTSGLDLDDTTFISGGSGHAIYITQAGTYDFTNVICTGYGGTGTAGAAIYNNSGGTVTINASGCSGLTYFNGTSATTNIVSDPVTTTITVKDINTGSVLQYARVLLVASDATGDLPYQESVTVSRIISTATVTHTGHGMATGDFALIQGATQEEYNGCFEITVITANTYTYTVPGTPTSPATGTITSTGGIFNSQTNASGIVTDSRTITNDQPVVGRVRLSTGTTLYKSSPIDETIDNATGLSVTVYLIPDA
jgi:hypothetical protein